MEPGFDQKRSQALIIFVKNPVPGKVKTRLAKSIGNEKAAEVYVFLLDHTRAITGRLTNTQCFVYYDDAIDERDLWSNAFYRQRLQLGQDLGERMRNAFADCFQAGFSSVVVIGSDCPEIQTRHLRQAFQLLGSVETVIGPAFDGGYYLLGMNSLCADLFTDIAWSTADVLAQTRQKLAQLGLSLGLLETLSDVDDEKDYQAMKSRFERR
ncbi:MAG: TIGR04282 family arsenosugar biosynthesis glycosyltransferase [Ferruginibacter sp.]|nr:TIGR04282 family arsenosugar biosynthesis glycosyltransferase [Cytophagales bacterium]